MEQIPEDELVETEDGKLIRLSYSRPWPRSVVAWSIRRRQGDTDFPVVSGEVEVGPPASADDDVWQSLREQALQQASEAPASETSHTEKPGSSWLGRLFKR